MNTFAYPPPETKTEKPKSGLKNKTYSPGLTTLLSIRDYSFSMEKHGAQLLKIEKDLGELTQNALAHIKDHCPAESYEKIKGNFEDINKAMSSINQVLHAVKEKILNKNNPESAGLWKQLNLHLNGLKKSFQNLEDSDVDALPENIQVQWAKDIFVMEDRLLPLVVSYTEASSVELQMIERYSEDELGKVSQMIYQHLPKGFTLEEAAEYEKDYLSALQDFKQEFKKEKNLWDTFLDILAGGTHQSPSEHVMMERWIEGEKQGL